MNEQELEQVFNKYADSVYRICYTYLGNAADSEDAVQDVFIKYMCKSPHFSEEKDRKAWLIVTACNHCKSRLRWKKRHAEADVNTVHETGKWDSSDAEFIDLISALPEECRQVVYLHCCEEYSLADIARLCRRKPSTVRSQMFYARKKLRKVLGGKEDEL